jgi:CRP/FNR family cyclic AMP-dependent transcriptional regulator
MLRTEPTLPLPPAVPTFASSPVRARGEFPEQLRRRAPVADGPSAGVPTEVDWGALLAGIAAGRTVRDFGPNRGIFTQGDAATSVYFVVHGQVKLTVISPDGKSAIVATPGPGDFFGEGCLIGQARRMATATSMADGCRVMQVEKSAMAHVLHDSPGLAQAFMVRLLSRVVRYEADLADQMINSSERRLARVLLGLSRFTNPGESERVVPGISQEHLAQMVGTTRSRVNYFMMKFRKLGLISYDTRHGLTVHRSLLRVVGAD